ncbi:MAG: hypothetical protein Q8O00_12575, partial [Holophaga sp.]|nr:hypothetical protein [Holophaga sp.]
ITISASPTTATVAYGGTKALTGTTSNGTIAWTLPTGQGTLSAATGTASTYTAPAFANQLADLTATVTLTNSLSSAKTATSVITVKTFNVNGDSVIDLRDILTLALDWGTASSRSDLNGDGIVDLADLTLLQNALGL